MNPAFSRLAWRARRGLLSAVRFFKLMKYFIYRILYFFHFIKIKEQHVKILIKPKTISRLTFFIKYGDWRLRLYVAKHLSSFDFRLASPYLIALLHDPVKPVAFAAIESLRKIDKSKDIADEIEHIILQWEQKEKIMNENWNKSDFQVFPGKLFDRSQMVRYQELLELIKKPKGMMSIG